MRRGGLRPLQQLVGHLLARSAGRPAQVLYDCASLPLADVLPACNATDDVAALQGSITQGARSGAAAAAQPPLQQRLSGEALLQVPCHVPRPASTLGTGHAPWAAAKVPGAQLTAPPPAPPPRLALPDHPSCADMSVSSQTLFLIQVPAVAVEAMCTAQSTFFADALGRATGVKSFYEDETNLCTSVGLGTCAEYSAGLTAYGAPPVQECTAGDLQPNYSAYLLARYTAIAQLYSSGEPSHLHAGQERLMLPRADVDLLCHLGWGAITPRRTEQHLHQAA